jgi:5'-nucleotidase (lipoprotein e(P4) family)
MRKFFVVTALALLAACSSQHKITATVLPQPDMVVNGKLFTAFYQQQAAEYNALCYQAYNIARLRLDEALQQTTTKPKAIITDIDETVLNNSSYSVHQALRGKDYDFNSWMDWTSHSMADTLAGTVSFFNYAASKNVEVFYVTNRSAKERQGTLKNLQRYNFPYADSLHLICRQGTNSKEVRRQAIAATHDIVLLLGDNLADFSDLFDAKTVDERLQNTRSSSAEFGKRFIVLPNPNYGDWESAQYQYNYKLTPAQKDSSIKSVLKSY